VARPATSWPPPLTDTSWPSARGHLHGIGDVGDAMTAGDSSRARVDQSAVHTATVVVRVVRRPRNWPVNDRAAHALDGETSSTQPSANDNLSYHSWVNVAMVREGPGGLKRK
jgi:hypothetical protein